MTDASVTAIEGVAPMSDNVPKLRPGPKRAAQPAAAPAKKPGRKVDPARRKEAILAAALTVFAERGYEAARLDDVAARAGVAKGTLYLYFKDKETLFEELLRGSVAPILEAVTALSEAPDMPFEQALDTLYGYFEKEVLGTDRKLLMRLVLTEGPRFPRIAEAHYRNVVSRMLPLIQKIAARAAERGELASDAVVRFPQLVAEPIITTIIWDALFAKIAPLDVAGLLRAHRDMLLAKPQRGAP
jgi:AcrR family transcriptional regulator